MNSTLFDGKNKKTNKNHMACALNVFYIDVHVD